VVSRHDFDAVMETKDTKDTKDTKAFIDTKRG
jgi:hypothetical protein